MNDGVFEPSILKYNGLSVVRIDTVRDGKVDWAATRPGRGRAGFGSRRDRRITGGGVDAAVAQQDLNDTSVDPVFQQMGGETVPPGSKRPGEERTSTVAGMSIGVLDRNAVLMRSQPRNRVRATPANPS